MDKRPHNLPLALGFDPLDMRPLTPAELKTIDARNKRHCAAGAELRAVAAGEVIRLSEYRAQSANGTAWPGTPKTGTTWQSTIQTGSP